MLSEGKKKRIDTLIEGKGDDLDKESGIAIVRRALLEMNSLEGAFYALFDPSLRDAVDLDDYEFDDKNFIFLADSVKSRSAKQKIELAGFLLDLTKVMEDDDDITPIVHTALSLVEDHVAFLDGTDAEHLRRVLVATMKNFRWQEGDYPESIDTVIVLARAVATFADTV